MQVYYYKVLSRLGSILIPGERETEPLLPGDTLQVGEAGHALFQEESFPFKDSLILVGSTFLGEKPADEGERQGQAEKEGGVKPLPDQILAEILDAESPKAPPEEMPEAVDLDEELELPAAGAKVSEVMQFLGRLEKRGYTLAQLEEVRQRFQSVTIQREVERLKQDFLEQSLTIEG